jgi:predicted secreted hydrolase
VVCVAAPPAEVSVSPGDTAAAGFAQAGAPRTFVFPRDHAAHPEFRQEWWYVTGNLDAGGGERFGFELTFFRFALAPVAPPEAGSAWRTRQIWMAHFAITDVRGRRFRFAQKLSREALGLAGASAAPLRVWIDDWSLQGPGQATGGNAATWSLKAAEPGYQIELTLEPLGTPVLNGEQGLSRKSGEAGAASYYYSVPRLAVRGRLFRDGRPLSVQGLAWLDREWGSGTLGAQQSGWDWYALQLDDGTTLMFYALRDRTGARDAYSAGTWVEGSAGPRALSNAQVTVDVTDHWVNAQGDRYPSAWRLRIPALSLDLRVRPVLADQELKASPRYWEGAVDVSGARAGRRVAGRGYVELVGYAQERKR